MDVLGAVVEIVSVVCPLPVTEGGLKLQLLRAGKPEQEDEPKLTTPLKPACPVTVMTAVPELPGLMFTVEGFEEIVKEGAVTSTVIVLLLRVKFLSPE
jgi:hypothetical protein